MTDADVHGRTDPTGGPHDPTAGAEDPTAGADDPLEALVAEVVARVPGARAGLIAALARAAYRRVPVERIRGLNPDTTAARLGEALTTLQSRQPRRLALRVFNAADPATGTLVEVCAEDSPFLLSTVLEELTRLDLDVVEVLHPIIGVERDADGTITALLPARGAGHRESWLQLELSERLEADRLGPVAGSLRAVLADALVATHDFAAMRAAVEATIETTLAHADARYEVDEVDEVASLLRWLLADHFVLLGFREYDLVAGDDGQAVVVRAGSGLGILRDESASAFAEPVALDRLDPDLRARVEGGSLLTVSRTNRPSTVHRQRRMIYVGVKKVAEDGSLNGELRLLGLFAQRAQAEPASVIPVLRRKLRRILEAEDIVDHSYDERALRTLFEALPKHELFAAATADLRRILVGLLEAQERSMIRLLLRSDRPRRHVSAHVSVPRDRFTVGLRRRVQRLLADEFGAVGVDYHLAMPERGPALLHFDLHLRRDEAAQPDAAALESRITELARTWDEELAAALARSHGPAAGRRVARAWTGRFPPAYTEVTPVEQAVRDVGELDQLLAAERDTIRLTPRPGAGDGLLRLRLYRAGPGLELSSFLPILESLGLVVVEEIPYRIQGERELHLHDFGVRLPESVAVDLEVDGARLARAAVAIWEQRAAADSLNRLVLRAGLEWEEVAVLRAYRRYRRQVGTSFTELYQDDALVEHPDVASALVGLFAARFDPAAPDNGDDVTAARRRVLEGLEAVDRLDQDRILRGWLGLVDATLRTNHYVPTTQRRSAALALKFDSAAVPDMPQPVPHRETFVYAPVLEGVHLRGGMVARGGIRWSDRQEDFRTEVLGLMKAQMTKNAVIVPTGAKGGFVRKGEVRGPQGIAEAYRTFVRALLDVTDNVVGGEVVGPAHVRRRDGDDPYLVVAPDRGTASLSDTANAISEGYGFWLGDAFASGGSHGYDHKAMGITARGAWTAVTRHFRELGVDVATEPIDVAGVGDMSGDVFGNGMLQSSAIRLVAAFDHRDIFLDPDPDPEVSYAERARLFGLPRSSWRDYDPALISRGGGVWSRTSKVVRLSPEARALLRVEEERLAPPEVIRAILRAPVDLLFAGGIGTYVKASDERHGDVGDRANDAVRLDADQVGARVIGEGANLAVTQRGRIQYARRGGRCNTDAIDNCAGVATSDREVNLKILLGMDPDLDRRQRDALLTTAVDEVATSVLRDVEAQTAALSQELAASPGGLEAYETLMSDLEADGRLDRAVESLPSTAELERRADAGAGLTRPELAVLIGYAKLHVTDRLIDSPLPDETHLAPVLRTYFPRAAVDRCGALVGRHRLRRELIATVVANELVNRMGITYASRTGHELGASVADVAYAYRMARDVTGAHDHWRAIDALDGHVDPVVQLDAKAEVDRVVDAVARGYLRERGRDLAGVVARDRPPFAELEGVVWELGPPARRTARNARAQRLVDAGVDPVLAERIAGLADLAIVPDVAAVARASGEEVRRVADVFLWLSQALPLDRLHACLNAIEPAGDWRRWHHRGLADELRALRRDAAARVVARSPEGHGAAAVDRYLQQWAGDRSHLQALVRRLEREPEAGLDGVAVAVRALRTALDA